MPTSRAVMLASVPKKVLAVISEGMLYSVLIILQFRRQCQPTCGIIVAQSQSREVHSMSGLLLNITAVARGKTQSANCVLPR